MKAKTVEFLTSAKFPAQYPKESLPEIAFAGRSNVGKSSLINALLQRKRVAKISSTPGKTQLINFFKIDQQLIFVDLPGYGYARVPEAIRVTWRPMMEAYLAQRRTLRAVVHILDIRIGPTDLDIIMREWLDHYRIPAIAVLNKSDKLGKEKRREMGEKLKETPYWRDTDMTGVIFSSKTGEGREELWHLIEMCKKTSPRR